MKLSLEENTLHIKLNILENIFSLHGSLQVPLDLIVRASTEKPEGEFGQIRAPGTHIPFLLKAGTFFAGNNREFWFKTIGRPYLVIDTNGGDYNRIVLTKGDNAAWAERINKALKSTVK